MGRLASGIVGDMLKISGWLFVAVFSKARELDLEDLVVREDFSLFAFASRNRSLAAASSLAALAASARASRTSRSSDEIDDGRGEEETCSIVADR